MVLNMICVVYCSDYCACTWFNPSTCMFSCLYIKIFFFTVQSGSKSIDTSIQAVRSKMNKVYNIIIPV